MSDRELHDIAAECVCSACGGGLAVPWRDGALKLWCHKCKGYVGHVKPDIVLQKLFRQRAKGGDTTTVDSEIEEHLKRKATKGGKGMVNEAAMVEFRQTGMITEQRALEVIGASKGFKMAPLDVQREAAVICNEFGLMPGVHVYLVKYGQAWAVVLGIDADRMAIAHLGPQFVDGPRMMTEAEQESIYGDSDKAVYRTIVRIRSAKTGADVVGYGVWKKSDTPFGADKGNSGQNMAFIRAERQACRKLNGRKLPSLTTVDDQYVERNGVIADRGTGEIIEGEATVIAQDEIVPVIPEGAAAEMEEKINAAWDEIEDKGESPRPERQAALAPPQSRSQGTVHEPTGAKLTLAQARENLRDRIVELNWTNEEAKAWLADNFEGATSATVTAHQVSTAMGVLMMIEPKEPQESLFD